MLESRRERRTPSSSPLTFLLLCLRSSYTPPCLYDLPYRLPSLYDIASSPSYLIIYPVLSSLISSALRDVPHGALPSPRATSPPLSSPRIPWTPSASPATCPSEPLQLSQDSPLLALVDPRRSVRRRTCRRLPLVSSADDAADVQHHPLVLWVVPPRYPSCAQPPTPTDPPADGTRSGAPAKVRHSDVGRARRPGLRGSTGAGVVEGLLVLRGA